MNEFYFQGGEKLLKIETLIILVLLFLLFSISLTADCSELTSEQIQVTIRIDEYLDVDFIDDSLTLDLDEAIENDLEFVVSVNFPVSISFESRKGFAEEINKYFEYVIFPKSDDIFREEQSDEKIIFPPGGEYCPQESIDQEPGIREWKLKIRLKGEISGQWQSLIEADFEGVELLDIDDNWTRLPAGKFEDILLVTFHSPQ